LNYKQIEDLGQPDDDVLAPGAIKDMMIAKGPFPATTSVPAAEGPVTNLGVVGTLTRKKTDDDTDKSEAAAAQPPTKRKRNGESE